MDTWGDASAVLYYGCYAERVTKAGYLLLILLVAAVANQSGNFQGYIVFRGRSFHWSTSRNLNTSSDDVITYLGRSQATPALRINSEWR